MAEARFELAVEVDPAADEDAEDLARLTYKLRAELLRVDVEAVRTASNGLAPDHSKGIDLVPAGHLMIKLAGHEALRAVIESARSWLARQRRRTIRLTLDGDSLELTGATSAEQDRLIDLWVARHAGDC